MEKLDANARRTAAQEARILEQLNHPNIIQFRDVYKTVNFQLDIVMEFADGGDLNVKMIENKRYNRKFTEEELIDMCT